MPTEQFDSFASTSIQEAQATKKGWLNSFWLPKPFNQHLDIYLKTFPANTQVDIPHRHPKPGREFPIAISGRLRFTKENESFMINPGDYFPINSGTTDFIEEVETDATWLGIRYPTEKDNKITLTPDEVFHHFMGIKNVDHTTEQGNITQQVSVNGLLIGPDFDPTDWRHDQVVQIHWRDLNDQISNPDLLTYSKGTQFLTVLEGKANLVLKHDSQPDVITEVSKGKFYRVRDAKNTKLSISNADKAVLVSVAYLSE